MAVAMLAGCAGAQPPIGATGQVPQTSAIAAHAEPGAVSSYLYVADPGLHAIIAFDPAGNKVAEKTFKTLVPVDVVTDSRGHVYADVFTKNNFSSVREYTHSLDHQIAEYHPPGFSSTMTVDVDDNLYVESESAGGFQQAIVRYPYGSTRVEHTYKVLRNAPSTATMAGISVRGKVLYTTIVMQSGFPHK